MKRDDVLQFLSTDFARCIQALDRILVAEADAILATSFSALAALSGGARIYEDAEDSRGDRIIVYSAFLTLSGGGKSSTVSAIYTYMLRWLDEKLQHEQREKDRERARLENDLRHTRDKQKRLEVQERLTALSPTRDVFISDATYEGLLQSLMVGSMVLFFIDNFGKQLRLSERNDNKLSLFTLMDNLYDAGQATEKRIKGDQRKSGLIEVKSFGLYIASTIGPTNLRMQDISGMIEDGFLNKFIITYQPHISKPIPKRVSLRRSDEESIEKFAMAYHELASSVDLVLSPEARLEYYAYHEAISGEFTLRYNSGDSLAGRTLRKLKLVKRIAAILEISSRCLRDSPDVEERARTKIEIRGSSLRNAVSIIEWLERRHTMKLLARRPEHDRLERKIETICKKIQDLCMRNHGGGVTVRDITQRLSKVQRREIDVNTIVKWLLDNGKAVETTDGKICLPPP